MLMTVAKYTVKTKGATGAKHFINNISSSLTKTEANSVGRGDRARGDRKHCSGCSTWKQRWQRLKWWLKQCCAFILSSLCRMRRARCWLIVHAWKTACVDATCHEDCKRLYCVFFGSNEDRAYQGEDGQRPVSIPSISADICTVRTTSKNSLTWLYSSNKQVIFSIYHLYNIDLLDCCILFRHSTTSNANTWHVGTCRTLEHLKAFLHENGWAQPTSGHATDTHTHVSLTYTICRLQKLVINLYLCTFVYIVIEMCMLCVCSTIDKLQDTEKLTR